MVYYSFVLLCYNKWFLTKEAIETFLKSFDTELEDKGIELIIVNNGSTDETYDNLQRLKSSHNGNITIELINIKENIGFISGINEGLSQVKGEYITVLNNDLIFPKNWFSGIIKSLESDQSLGVAVPFLSSAGNTQSLKIKLNSFDEIQSFSNTFTNRPSNNNIYINRVISACLTMKKIVFDAIGGFDFWFGLAMFDDDDFCIRVRLLGYKIAIIGTSFVYHVCNATFSDYKDMENAAFLANQNKFMNKWNISDISNLDLRDTAIYKNNYDKMKHFFPARYSDYLCLNEAKNIQSNNCLLVADWTNPTSHWKSKLKQFIINNPHSKMYLFIPNQYFNVAEITNELNIIFKYLNKNYNISNISYEIISSNIHPYELIRFINKFDNIIAVDNDFVNKYIVNLSLKNNKNIL